MQFHLQGPVRPHLNSLELFEIPIWLLKLNRVTNFVNSSASAKSSEELFVFNHWKFSRNGCKMIESVDQSDFWHTDVLVGITLTKLLKRAKMNEAIIGSFSVYKI